MDPQQVLWPPLSSKVAESDSQNGEIDDLSKMETDSLLKRLASTRRALEDRISMNNISKSKVDAEEGELLSDVLKSVWLAQDFSDDHTVTPIEDKIGDTLKSLAKSTQKTSATADLVCALRTSKSKSASEAHSHPSIEALGETPTRRRSWYLPMISDTNSIKAEKTTRALLEKRLQMEEASRVQKKSAIAESRQRDLLKMRLIMEASNKRAALEKSQHDHLVAQSLNEAAAVVEKMSVLAEGRQRSLLETRLGMEATAKNAAKEKNQRALLAMRLQIETTNIETATDKNVTASQHPVLSLERTKKITKNELRQSEDPQYRPAPAELGTMYGKFASPGRGVPSADGLVAPDSTITLNQDHGKTVVDNEKDPFMKPRNVKNIPGLNWTGESKSSSSYDPGSSRLSHLEKHGQTVDQVATAQNSMLKNSRREAPHVLKKDKHGPETPKGDQLSYDLLKERRSRSAAVDEGKNSIHGGSSLGKAASEAGIALLNSENFRKSRFEGKLQEDTHDAPSKTLLEQLHRHRNFRNLKGSEMNAEENTFVLRMAARHLLRLTVLTDNPNIVKRMFNALFRRMKNAQK